MIAPVRALIRVDFPAPLSPMMASTSPGKRSMSTPSRPITRPNVLISLRPDSTVVVGSARSPAGPRDFSSVVEDIGSALDLSDPLVDRDGDDDEDADRQDSELVVDPGQREAGVEGVDDQGTEDGAEDAAAAAEEAPAAPHPRRNSLPAG